MAEASEEVLEILLRAGADGKPHETVPNGG
jgi:hypothetical protein